MTSGKREPTGRFWQAIVGIVVPYLLFGLLWILKACANPENLTLHRAALNVFTFPEWLTPTKRARDIRHFFGLSKGF